MRTAALLTGGFVLSNVSACKKSESQGPSRRGVAAKPLDSEGRPQPSDQDRCAMCAMRVADHPEWIGAIELDDGTTFYFCSVRCTLGSALRAPEFLKSEASHIRRTRVPDYLVKDRWIDADSALFVVDSDVKGPMGLELVPVGRQDDADVVVRRHGGRVVRRAEVTIDLLRDLKARSAAPK